MYLFDSLSLLAITHTILWELSNSVQIHISAVTADIAYIQVIHMLMRQYNVYVRDGLTQ